MTKIDRQAIEERANKAAEYHRLGFFSPAASDAYARDVPALLQALDDAQAWETRATRWWKALCAIVDLCGGLVPEHAPRAPEYVRDLLYQAKRSEAVLANIGKVWERLKVAEPALSIAGVKISKDLDAAFASGAAQIPKGTAVDAITAREDALAEARIVREENSRAWAALTGNDWTSGRPEGSLVQVAESVVRAARQDKNVLAAVRTACVDVHEPEDNDGPECNRCHTTYSYNEGSSIDDDDVGLCNTCAFSLLSEIRAALAGSEVVADAKLPTDPVRPEEPKKG